MNTTTAAERLQQERDEHEALLQFLYLAPTGLVQAALDGAIAMINPVAAQLLMPLAADSSLDNLFTALEGVAPDLRPLCRDFAAPQGIVCDGKYLHIQAGAQGKNAARVLSLSVVKLGETRLMAVLTDVTAQVRRERELRQTDAWLNAIITSIADYALVRLDHAGRIESWNESIGRVTGFTAAQTVGQSYALFYPAGATTGEHLSDRLREADRDGWSLDDGMRLRADGSSFRATVMISPLPDLDEDGASAYSLVIRDVGDKAPAGERARHAALSDYLTGLGNRRAFFESAELELERRVHLPRPTAMIMIDADHFKAINDQHGHAGGDAVLRHLGGCLKHTFREVDVVARVGGEEFAVLLPSTSMAGAAAVAERLRMLIAAAAVKVGDASISYTVSAGVAAVDAEATSLEALMNRADQALYAAKGAGRNRVVSWTEALADSAAPALEGSDGH